MPPRKSNTSQITNATTNDETANTPVKEREGINIEDLSLPRTMVQRLAKGVLPSNTQIQKDALTAMSKAATVFVNYLSQAANTTAAYSTRKTIAPEAVIEALDDIEFADFVPRVQAELKRFNEVQTGKRNEYRRKLKEKEVEKGDGVGLPGDDGEERAAKRVRREGGAATTSGSGARGSIGTAGMAKGSQALRGKEEKVDQEEEEKEGDDEQLEEDLEVTGVTEDFEAEQETEGGQAGEGGSEAEAGEEDDDDEDDEEDSSGADQDDIDVDIDDADLRERAIRRGRRGEYAVVDDDDDDDATGSSGASEGASETESDRE